MPSVLLEATTDEDASDSYNIIVQRGECDAQSKEYLFGIVSWEPEAETEPQQISQIPDSGKTILATFDQTASKFSNFIDCNVDQFGDDRLCQRAIKVQNLTVKPNAQE